MRLGSRPVISIAVAVLLASAIGTGRRTLSRRALPAGRLARLGATLDFHHGLLAQGGQAAAPTKPKMVEDVFTNVQELKGLGVDDFLLTMGIMSAAVGSDCVGCHPSAGTDHVDWALDTPRKRTARRMVQMVTAIKLDVVYGPPTDEPDDVLTQAQAVPSVDQVLDKYLQAIGGTQNVARVTSFVATGKSVGYRGFGGGGVVDVSAQAPDKRATHIRFPEYPDRGVSVRTYDGRTGWIATPLAAVRKYELAGSERDGARVDAMLSFPAQIKQALANV